MTSCPAEYDIFDETSGRIWYDKVRLRQDRFPECAIAAGEIRMHRNGSCRAASVCGGTGKSLLRKSDEALDSNWGIAVYREPLLSTVSTGQFAGTECPRVHGWRELRWAFYFPPLSEAGDPLIIGAETKNGFCREERGDFG